MWHFSKLDKKLGYGDGRVIRSGSRLTVPEPIQLCHKGLHASPRLIDALKYAPGTYIWKVELSGIVRHDTDKSVATERKAVWGYDATDVLRAFARRVALDAIQKYWTSKTLGEFPAVALEWLKTGKGDARAAAEAAYAAAYAAYAAADAAAYAAYAAYAARAARAARAAAYAADAAAYAARAAAYAADAAAYAEQNEWLEEMILAGRPKK